MNPLQALSDNIVIDTDKCIFCGICVERCILDNLRMQFSPCRQACPLHTNCQGYVQAVARGEVDKASEILRESLPFPGIMGRICPHPCEQECNRNQVDGEGVGIRAIKRFIAEAVPPEAPTIERERDERVAIVGAGPAGLLAAHDLRALGYQVTVLDANDAPGGMLRVGVPEFRLSAETLDAEIEPLRQMGVEFRCGVRLGEGLTFDSLASAYNAVLLATGAHVSHGLDIPGVETDGVHDGLAFLGAAKAGEASEIGDRVVVIGGGNSAMDAAQTVVRLGAQHVAVACLEQRHEMPAHNWEVEDVLAAGVEILTGWGPTGLATDDGRVQAVALRQCTRAFDDDGAFAPEYDDAVTRSLDADTVIIAIGQRCDLSFLPDDMIEDGLVAVDELTLQTRRPNVFAAGDCVTGPLSVPEAMAGGRRAAESIQRLLRGEDLRYERGYAGPYDFDFEVDLTRALERTRVQSADGTGGCYSVEEAKCEAERCLSCGVPYGAFRTCWFCLPCEVDCPEQALYVEVPYLLR